MEMVGLPVGADSSEVYSEFDMENSLFLYSDEELVYGHGTYSR